MAAGDAVARDWLLGAGGRLAPAGDEAPEAGGGPSRYTYDPADPTPAVGGPSLGAGFLPGDNAEYERRADVLTFTSPILREPIEVIGEPVATISLGSDREHTDLFVRLCDVHPDGRSMTVCDGVRRLRAPATARALHRAHQEVHHDAGHRSRITLPTTTGRA